MNFRAVTSNLAVLMIACLAQVLSAQELPRDELVAGLQAGGKVIVMRHASSPRDLPDIASASPGNVDLERQLDAQGREDAGEFGEALRRLGIPITETGTSPTFRAMETARQAGLDNITPYEQLGNEGMQESGEEKADWLQTQVSLKPARGNRLLITHTPNINAAFPEVGRTREGEALIFDPDVSITVPVGRIAIDAWPTQ